MRSNARELVRTRSTGVISFWTVRIGFTRSVEPIQALAAPIRPPRRRNSSVSIANQSRSSPLRLAEARDDLGGRRARRGAARGREDHQAEAPGGGRGVEHVHPLAPLALAVERSAARRADSGVPDRPPEMCTDTTSPPSARSGS